MTRLRVKGCVTFDGRCVQCVRTGSHMHGCTVTEFLKLGRTANPSDDANRTHSEALYRIDVCMRLRPEHHVALYTAAALSGTNSVHLASVSRALVSLGIFSGLASTGPGLGGMGRSG